MAYNYGVKNTDPNFVVDPVTRSITQKSGKSKLMQHDHNSECYGFEITRFVDGHDMSLCNVTIHYINVSSNKSSVASDSYPASDVSVVGDKVVFTWLVSRNATQYAGTLNFAISFERSTDGAVDYSWHTDVFKGISICETIFGDGSETVEPYSDVLTQWQSMLFGIGDTEEASIKEVSQTEQNAITDKGAAVLASIPEDYTATYNMADEAVRTKGDAIAQSVEGELAVVSDSSDDHFRGLRVFGKSTQKTTTGAQLCNFPDVESYTIEGITWSCKNGVVKVRGTSTAISSSSKEIKFNFPIKAGTYYLLGYTANVMLLCCVTDSSGSLHYYQHAFVLDGTEKSALIYCQIDSGKTLNETIYPMVAVTDGATFESYSGGFVSPGPDWPQEISSVVDVSVSICGKNLLNHSRLSSTSIGNITVTNASGRVTISGSGVTTEACNIGYSVNHDELVNIVHVGEINLLTVKSRPYLSVTLLDNVTSEKYLSLYHNTPSGMITQEMLDNENLVMNVSVSCGVGEEIIPAVFSPMLYQHGDDTWDSYKIPQSIQIDRTLPGIPVSSNGNYTDEDGRQWICDEIDFERGVYIKRIHHLNITGSSSFVEFADSNGLTLQVTLTSLHGGSKYGNGACMCNYFPTKANNWHAYNNTVSLGGSYAERVQFSFTNDFAMTQTEFLEWLSEKELYVNYVLATPIETPLTAEELTAFKSLHSNYPNTVVLNNAGAHMELKYNADTKLYIDNKFAELAAMITSNT